MRLTVTLKECHAHHAAPSRDDETDMWRGGCSTGFARENGRVGRSRDGALMSEGGLCPSLPPGLDRAPPADFILQPWERTQCVVRK